jgi:hypothetical protein
MHSGQIGFWQTKHRSDDALRGWREQNDAAGFPIATGAAGGVASWVAGLETETRNEVPRGGAIPACGCVTCGCWASFSAMTMLAKAVPSAPHFGQAIGIGS